MVAPVVAANVMAAPPAATASIQSTAIVQEGPYWNTWVANSRPEYKRHEGASIAPGASFYAILDISRYQYLVQGSGLGAGKVAAPVVDAIKNAIARKWNSVKFVVRPMITGGSIAAGAGFQQQYILKVNLKKLLPTPGEEIKHLRIRDNYSHAVSSDDDSLESVSSELSAAIDKVMVSLEAKEGQQGCSQIVFSIWSGDGTTPLDYVVHTVSIRPSGQEGPGCEGFELQTGAGAIAGFASNAGKNQNDAVFLFLEFRNPEGHLDSGVFFVDTKAYKSGASGVFSWQLGQSLTQFLRFHLKKEMYDPTLDQSIRAAREFGNLIFSTAHDERGRDEAKSARNAFENLKGDNPRVFVKARTAEGKPLYVPLALLSAGTKAGAGKYHLINEPLPLERPASNEAETCVREWTFVMEPKNGAVSTGGNTSDSRSSVSQLALPTNQNGDPGDYISEFLTDDRYSKKYAERVVMVAHHDTGFLRFTNGLNEAGLPVSTPMRTFENGSVTVLLICSGAGPEEDETRIMDELNNKGVDCVVASPYPIQKNDAELLAQTLSAELKSGEWRGKSFVDLLLKSVRKASESFGAGNDYEKNLFLNRMRLLVVAGNHQIKICNPEKKK